MGTVDPSISISDRFVIVFSLALFNPYLIFQIAIIIALFIYLLFFSECILPGSVFWGLWTRKDNSLNYYRAFIKRITASHITFHLQTNNAQWRSYKRTEPVLVIDEIPEMKDISVNSSVIAVHKPSMQEWYRAGTVTGTNESLSMVHVRFKNGDQRLVPLKELRSVKRPKFCMDRV